MFSWLSRVLGFSRTERNDAAIIRKEAEDSFRLHARIKVLGEEIVDLEERLEQDKLEFIKRSGKSLRNSQGEGMLRLLEDELVKKLNQLKELLRKSEVEEHHMELFIDEIKKHIKQQTNAEKKKSIGRKLDKVA